MFRTLSLARHIPGPARVLRGGRLNDAGRLPRYALIFTLGAGALWAPITAYVTMTPASFTSEVSLILPGSGAQASVNLAEIGQASSSAASAFSSSRISPTQTYKRLLAANRTLARASEALSIEQAALGAPRIRLVDETALIHFEMTGPSPEAAQARATAVLEVFLDELDILRADELTHRDASSRGALDGYEVAVSDLREQIAAVQSESGLMSFDHYKEMVDERDAVAVRLDEARSTLNATRAAMASLSRQLGVDASAAALNLRLHADPEFRELANTLALHSSDLAQNRGRYGARHPKVTQAVQAVAGAEAKLATRGRQVLGGSHDLRTAGFDLAADPGRTALLSDLVGLSTKAEGEAASVAALESQLQQMSARVTRLAPQASRLDDLMRDHKVAEAVYASAAARTDTSKSDVFASYPLVQVLADASLPDGPTSPRPKIAIAAGIAATLMLLMGLALGWIRRPLIDRLLDRGAAA